MTISERINLHRCGYSRAEIEALAKEEKEAKAAEETTVTQDPVLEAIKGLTAAIQASNINKTAQPEPKKETVVDLLKNL